MNYAKLHKHLIALASLPKTDSPVVSAYLDFGDPARTAVTDFRRWAALTRQTFTGQRRQDFDDAVEEVDSWLSDNRSRSAAVFARWGEHPLFIAMPFEVPLENHFHVDAVPVIYPLVELKDRFNRFVVVLTTATSARIVEVNLGAQSVDLLTERPALRERIGREWTREHYMNHRRDRDRKFVKEKIAVIESLMAKRGHNSLVVAGDPRCVNRLVDALPAHLRERVVGQIKTGMTGGRLRDVIGQAVDSFLQAEAEEAHDVVDLLVKAVRAGGLATVGVETTRRALIDGRVGQLVVSSALLHEEREELVRLASRHDVPIETVQECEMLDRNGGAGALLRYTYPGDLIDTRRGGSGDGDPGSQAA